MRLTAVIFDLDGTLLDTIADIAAALNHVLASHGYPTHPTNAYKQMVGSGLVEVVRRALPAESRSDEELVLAGAQQMKSFYAKSPVAETKPFDGIEEMLEELIANGVAVAVLSNKAHELVQTIVALALPGVEFAAVEGFREGRPPKPDPTSALQIASTLRLPPEQILYVGDSDVDIHTAQAAGMPSVGVGWGFRGEEELSAAGARWIVHHPSQIVRILKENSGGDDGTQ